MAECELAKPGFATNSNSLNKDVLTVTSIVPHLLQKSSSLFSLTRVCQLQ